MNNENKERPKGMSEEEEAREGFREELKRVKLADLEDTIAIAITKLLNKPRIFFVCDIDKIKYQRSQTKFNVKLREKYKEREKTEEGT